MVRGWWRMGLLVGLLALPGVLGAQALKFVVPEYRPFTGTVDGKPAGLGVELGQKIFKEAGLTLQIKVVSNFSRCISEVQSGAADGFFLGSRAADRDAVAVLSDRVLSNRWQWVVPAGTAWDPKAKDFRAKVRVGVLLNSNPHTWLKDHGYTISGTPDNAANLLSMLDAKRFDVVLVPELIFLDGLKATGRSASAYTQTLEVEQAMGIYVSKTTLAAQPDLLTKINAAIKKLGL